MSLSLGREAQGGDHGENRVTVATENSSIGTPGLSEIAVASSSSPVNGAELGEGPARLLGAHGPVW